ncbi:hypothetical protein FR483_n753R [Paramecium bursaria Chlorella virus FR483]|uniref:Uncharacterized protein n753R n=1 Tax=Paramecium bursaria Chlorella virus FR483 TaxID=399781 RepID=A7J8A7_PBCVF|nr:hypothetical protein FR483_n753R [Paramecium bursaria Chlorella virus FR483]ABT16038.1 hypothetical protein FR483_n753R [Paramecium bursaria Chlorella virus FR483]
MFSTFVFFSNVIPRSLAFFRRSCFVIRISFSKLDFEDTAGISIESTILRILFILFLVGIGGYCIFIYVYINYESCTYENGKGE